MLRLLLLAFLVTVLSMPPSAQTHDQEITWRTYTAEHSARVRVFETDDARRPRTVVLDDRASNGAVITDDAAYIADAIGREIGFDPVSAVYVFRFTPASFVADASDRGKTLLLKVTFGRTASGNLGGAQWRVIGPDVLDELTDRSFR